MGLKRRQFAESVFENDESYGYYFQYLVQLAISMFEWKGLPDGVDARFLELTLLNDGQAVFFKDEVMGYLCLQVLTKGQMNVYRIPIDRRAFAVNGYQRDLTDEDSVIVYNNYLHSPDLRTIRRFAKRLWDLDGTIDVNAKAQKTPLLIQGTINQRQTLINLYKQYDGNTPVIFGDKTLDINSLKVLQTNAPYVGDKLYTLKSQIWNEALTYLGISNLNTTKKERMISDEASYNTGVIYASRYSRLNARKDAADAINRMFGLNVSVDFREDFRVEDEEVTGKDE